MKQNSENNSTDNNAARKFQECNKKINEHMIKIQQWRNDMMEEYEKKKSAVIEEYKNKEQESEIWDEKKIKIFSAIYLKLMKFFFNLQIIDSTLRIRSNEIKQLLDIETTKYIKLSDLKSIWEKLYPPSPKDKQQQQSDDTKTDDDDNKKKDIGLNFVISESESVIHKDFELRALCKKILGFMEDYHNNNYPIFVKDFTIKLICNINTEGFAISAFIDDMPCNTVCVLNEKDFCADLLSDRILAPDNINYFDDVIAFVVINYPPDALLDDPTSEENYKKLEELANKCWKTLKASLLITNDKWGRAWPR